MAESSDTVAPPIDRGNARLSWLGRLTPHPFVLVAALVLELALRDGVQPPGFARPLLIGLVAVGIVFGGLWLLLRNPRLAALLTTVLLLATVSHNEVIWLLGVLRDALGSTAGSVAFALLCGVGVAGGVLLARRIRRTGRPRNLLATTTRILNAYSIALLALVLLRSLPLLPQWVPSGDATATGEPTTAPPNVYLFILDGYARADELESRFIWDNSGFIGGLESRGFWVDPQSTSNHTYTSLTLPALFEMDYLTEEASAVFSRTDLLRRFDDALRHGAGIEAVRQAGYRIIATAAGWEHVSLRDAADSYLDRPELTDLERFLLLDTWIPDLPIVPRNLLFADLHSRVLGILDDVAGVAEGQRDPPLFVIAHVPAPHLPLAFAADGGAPDFSSRDYGATTADGLGLSQADFDQAYGAALDALNQRVLASIDRIVAADADAVVILMSDHGFSDDAPVHGISLLRNLFAARTPGHANLFPPSITPVNVLRLLLEAYADLPLGEALPDRWYTTRIDGDTITVTATGDPG